MLSLTWRSGVSWARWIVTMSTANVASRYVNVLVNNYRTYIMLPRIIMMMNIIYRCVVISVSMRAVYGIPVVVASSIIP
jgi:hypothetical protein